MAIVAQMKYAMLGSTGLKVPKMSLGTLFRSGLDEHRCLRAIECAADLGCTFLDTANIYHDGGSEEIVGQAIRGRRDKFLVTSKVGMQKGPEAPLSRQTIFREIEGSLKRLQTDYLDLYLCHIPDPATPLEETLRAMDDLTHQGKTRYVGLSNYPAWQLCEGSRLARQNDLSALVCNQVSYSVLDRRIEDELLPLCRHWNVAVTVYCTTFIGLLSGDYNFGEAPVPGRSWDPSGPYRYDLCANPDTERITDACRRIGRNHGVSAGIVAMAWAMCRTEVASLITGADTEDRVRANFKALDIELDSSERADLDSVSRGKRMTPREGQV